MGVNRVIKRGKIRIEVRRQWPDRSTFRRYYPNHTLAKSVLARIEESIVMGTWQEFREELSLGRGGEADLTVREFSRIYLKDYCKDFNRRPDFKVQALVSINAIMGDLLLKNLSIKDRNHFVTLRSRSVAPATINRGLSVISHMLNVAVEQGYLKSNPYTGAKMLPEEKRSLRVMTLEEEKQLVLSVAKISPVVGAYVAVLGETGLRKSEGLRMQWIDVNRDRKMLGVPRTKTGKPRYVPLSPYALSWLDFLPRYADSPWVFNLASGEPLRNPRTSFDTALKRTGFTWVRGFHDLRHYRATQWLNHGVDIQTVKFYLGHERIETTQRYLHFVPNHGEETVREAQIAEELELEQLMSGRQMGDTSLSNSNNQDNQEEIIPVTN